MGDCSCGHLCSICSFKKGYRNWQHVPKNIAGAMELFERWVDKVVSAAVADGSLQEEDREVARYGLIWGLQAIATLLTVVLLGALLGSWQTALIAALVSASFRFVSGGAHLQSATMCLALSALLLAGAGYGASRLAELLDPEHNMTVVTLCVSLGLFAGLKVIYDYVPVDNPNRPIASPAEKARFRTLSLAIMLLLMGLFIVLAYSQSTMRYALALWAGYCLQLLSLTPAMGILARKVG